MLFRSETDYFGDTWILAWSDAARDSIVAARPPRGRGLDLRSVVSRQGSALEAAITLPEPDGASLEVFDVQGRRVHQQRIEPGAAGARTVRIDPPVPLTAGVYLLRVVQGRESRTARAIVLR